MRKLTTERLTRRERQVMDALYKLERATVGQVLAQLKDKPSYSTVRALLGILESKGHVRHEDRGLRYVYIPVVPRDLARRSALRHVVETFFDGSVEQVVAALLGGEVLKPSPQELERLRQIVAKSRKDQL